MPASDYTSTVSGGLKLKGGAKDSGIKKKKKSGSSSKKKSAPEPATTQDEQGEKSEEPQAAAGESSTALARQPQIDEDDEEQALENRRSRSSSAVPTNIAGSGKTEAQRRHEEIKRKRVSLRCCDSREHGSAEVHMLTFFLNSSTSVSGAKAERKRTSSESRS
jgi:hypothetical protein